MNAGHGSSTGTAQAWPQQATSGDGFTTTGFWFGPDERPLAGWWTAPERPSCAGVVIAAPMGYEDWSCYHSLRTLAESLARVGWHVLRFDWDGTGDSTGEAIDPDRVAAWHASLASAVAAMRNGGVQRVTLVGVRLDATLGLLDAAELGVEAVVACAPVVSGKRWLKELRMLGASDPENPESLTYSGLAIDTTTAADLARFDLVKAAPSPLPRTLLVTRSEPTDDKLIMAMRANGCNVDTHACDAMETMLDTPAGEDSTPRGWIEPIMTWLGSPHAIGAGICPPHVQSAVMSHGDNTVRESITMIDGLAAVLTEPVDRQPDTVVVFLNSGADPHVGPGRAWVEYARTLALHGYACVRPDFIAFGESPDDGVSPRYPYAVHCIDDTRRIVAGLRNRYRRVVLAGLCVGAWIAMLVAQTTRVEGVFALNPQLWWRPGLPIIIRIPDTIAWRAPMRRRQHLLARWGIWSWLDVLGLRPMASRWLIALRRRRIPVFLSYAEGDDGLAHLRDCCSRRLARELRSGWVTLEEVAGIDHPMFRTWRRPAIIEQMTRFLAHLPTSSNHGGR